MKPLQCDPGTAVYSPPCVFLPTYIIIYSSARTFFMVFGSVYFTSYPSMTSQFTFVIHVFLFVSAFVCTLKAAGFVEKYYEIQLSLLRWVIGAVRSSWSVDRDRETVQSS